MLTPNSTGNPPNLAGGGRGSALWPVAMSIIASRIIKMNAVCVCGKDEKPHSTLCILPLATVLYIAH